MRERDRETSFLSETDTGHEGWKAVKKKKGGGLEEEEDGGFEHVNTGSNPPERK